jgi:hypothetical protein
MIKKMFVLSEISRLYKKNIIDKETKDKISNELQKTINDKFFSYNILYILDELPENDEINNLINLINSN